MSRILELSPALGEPPTAEHPHVQGIWNARAEAEKLAIERGHDYIAPEPGRTSAADLDGLIADADALVLAPTVVTPTGMWQPTDGEETGRQIGALLLDRLPAGLPVVFVSHFLVGHGAGHANAKPNTWALRALEAHLRSGRNAWTILRPTWLSTIHDDSYQTRLTQDSHADGLVSTASVAAAVVTAVEHPEAARGRTAAVFNLSVPGALPGDLAAQFGALEQDYEAGVPA